MYIVYPWGVPKTNSNYYDEVTPIRNFNALKKWSFMYREFNALKVVIQSETLMGLGSSLYRSVMRSAL